MVDNKENYKFDLGVKGLTSIQTLCLVSLVSVRVSLWINISTREDTKLYTKPKGKTIIFF